MVRVMKFKCAVLLLASSCYVLECGEEKEEEIYLCAENRFSRGATELPSALKNACRPPAAVCNARCSGKKAMFNMFAHRSFQRRTRGRLLLILSHVSTS